MINSKLKQARQGIKFTINEDPEEIIINRKRMVDDGFGNLIEDPYDTNPDTITMTVRLSHDKKLPEHYQSAPPAFTSNMQRIITTDYESEIYEGDEFDSSLEKRYRIGAVDILRKFGGIIGYQATLIEAETITPES